MKQFFVVLISAICTYISIRIVDTNYYTLVQSPVQGVLCVVVLIILSALITMGVSKLLDK